MNGNSVLEDLAKKRPDLWDLTGVGVTRSETVIWALAGNDVYARTAARPRVMLVSGATGRDEDVTLCLQILQRWADMDEQPVDLTAVPSASPDRRQSDTGYPPEDGFYYDPDQPEERYLWRWTCLLAPDLVIEVRAGESTRWEFNEAAARLASSLQEAAVAPANSFVGALGQGAPEGLGTIPALRLTASPQSASPELDRLWPLLRVLDGSSTTTAAAELDRRRSRSPIEIGRILASSYGRAWNQVVYTEGVVVSGRLRLAALDDESPSPVEEITDLVAPLADPAVAFADAPDVGVTENMAALVWAEDLAAAGDRRFVDLLTTSAAKFTRGGAGESPPPARPNFPTEDHFFTGAVLGRGFALTGNEAYIDILADFLLDGHIQQGNGLFLHSRTGPFHWGRANGFAALGLTETLTYMPQDHPKRDAIESMLTRQMEAVRRFQEPSGMLRQVVDFPGAYQEFTSTAMTGYALARGLRLGWLDSSFQTTADMAWRGISERIDDQGGIIDACTGTGNGDTLRHYLDRPALTGHDDRSGSMALWFTTEVERLRRQSRAGQPQG